MIDANLFDLWHFVLFLAAAGMLALMPGPGIFYVAARTLAGGRGEGLASSFGTGLGGFVHVIAGAIGVSALVMASAEAFTVLNSSAPLSGLSRHQGLAPGSRLPRSALGGGQSAMGMRRAFKEGASSRRSTRRRRRSSSRSCRNSWCRQAGHVALQFIVLGTISVVINTAVDVVVIYGASAVRDRLAARPGIITRLRQASGGSCARSA